MTFDDLITLVRRLINERTATNITDQLVLDRLNAAYLELQVKVRFVAPDEFNEVTTAQNVVAGTSDYTRATYEAVRCLQLLSGTTWVSVPKRSLEQVTPMAEGRAARGATRTSYVYSVAPGNMWRITPTPGESVTSGLRAVYWKATTTALADKATASPLMPSVLHPYLAYRAAALILAAEFKEPDSAALQSIWEFGTAARTPDGRPGQLRLAYDDQQGSDITPELGPWS